ncbi:MAG: hypothetical protein ACREBF_04735 [Candidatus Micrarchaeales archaeon]
MATIAIPTIPMPATEGAVMGQSTLIPEVRSDEKKDEDGSDEQMEAYAAAVEWAMDNPETLKDEHLKKYVDFIKSKVAERLQQLAVQQVN